MTKALNYKKATSRNILVGIIFIFVSALIIVLLGFMFITLLDKLSVQPALSGAGEQNIINHTKSGVLVFDYLFLLIVVGLMISIGFLSYKLATRRVYFIISLIMASFYCFLGFILSYVYQQVVLNSSFSGILLLFPKTIFVTSNLHWFALGLFIIETLALYGKKEQGQFIEG